jgi:F-type H+-transporting ATPase subunit gamma
MCGPVQDQEEEDDLVSQRHDILKRRKAVGNIHTVTRTMQFVASSRFAQAQKLATQSRRYMTKLSETVGSLLGRNGRTVRHPLLQAPNPDAPVILVGLSSNRGLCGAYNNHVTAMTQHRRQQLLDAGCEVDLWTVGRKISIAFRREGLIPNADYDTFDSLPKRQVARRVTERFVRAFLDGKCSNIEIVYTQFWSPADQRVAIATMLPIGDVPHSHPPAGLLETPGEFEFVGGATLILERLIPELLRAHVWQCFADALASEHAQRYRAMQQANDNAEEMTRNLTLRANALRQEQITTELSEIVGGRMGLEDRQE